MVEFLALAAVGWVGITAIPIVAAFWPSRVRRPKRLTAFASPRAKALATKKAEEELLLEMKKLNYDIQKRLLSQEGHSTASWVELYDKWHAWLRSVANGQDTSSTFERVNMLRTFFREASKPTVNQVAPDFYSSTTASLSCLITPGLNGDKYFVSAIKESAFPEVFHAALVHPRMNDAKNDLERLTRFWAVYLLRTFRPSPDKPTVFTEEQKQAALADYARIEQVTNRIIETLSLDIKPRTVQKKQGVSSVDGKLRVRSVYVAPRARSRKASSIGVLDVPAQKSVDPRLDYLTSSEVLLIDQFQASAHKFTREERFNGEKAVERLIEAGKLALEAKNFTDLNRQKAERLASANRALLAEKMESMLTRLRDAEETAVVRSLRTQNKFLTSQEA